MVEIVSYARAMHRLQDAKRRHLLLGNGFSIALKPDIFTYGSLYANADFSAAPHVKRLFESMETQDFEKIIKYLLDAAKVVEVYRPSAVSLARRLRRGASAVKDALVTAIASRHPDRPFDIENHQYASCRSFLNGFDHIFTLNYDVLLYWTLMQDAVDDLLINHDDGFRHPEDDPEKPWVSWQQGNSATVSYLHGALHLFDAGSEIIKYTWSKTDIPIVEQIRSSLYAEKYPLFVAEGTSDEKLTKILHNGYLHKALRSFESCCSLSTTAVVIFGHSLDETDSHILRYIARGGCSDLAVSLFGDAASPANRLAIANAHALQEARGPARGRRPALRLTFFDAATAKVWG